MNHHLLIRASFRKHLCANKPRLGEKNVPSETSGYCPLFLHTSHYSLTEHDIYLLRYSGRLSSFMPSHCDRGQEIGSVMERDRRQELQQLVLDYSRATHYTTGLLATRYHKKKEKYHLNAIQIFPTYVKNMVVFFTCLLSPRPLATRQTKTLLSSASGSAPFVWRVVAARWRLSYPLPWTDPENRRTKCALARVRELK